MISQSDSPLPALSLAKMEETQKQALIGCLSQWLFHFGGGRGEGGRLLGQFWKWSQLVPGLAKP